MGLNISKLSRSELAARVLQTAERNLGEPFTDRQRNQILFAVSHELLKAKLRYKSKKL